jgi:hypothetical protein
LVDFVPQPSLTTNDPETMVDLALADAGIVQVALHHSLPQLRSGALKLLLAGLHHPGQRETVVHYPHRLYLAPRVRVLVDALLAHFATAHDLHVGVGDVLADMPQCAAGPVHGIGLAANHSQASPTLPSAGQAPHRLVDRYGPMARAYRSVNLRERSSVSNTAGSSVVARRSPVARR